MKEDIIELLHSGGYSCVIAKGEETRTFRQRGVADLYDLYEQEAEFLQGAHVADKVIGRGAAALIVLGGVQSVYTDTISEGALALLEEAGIEVRYAEKVPRIVNRDKTGWCPLETACSGIVSVKEMYPVIRDFVCKMRMNK